MTAPRRDAPDIIAPPPLLFIGAMAVGLAGHAVRPIPVLPPGYAEGLGVLLIASGLALGWWGIATMRRYRTNIAPNRPALALVAGGPFRFTRNPLYLATCCVYAGVALLVNALWPLLMLAPLIAVVDFGVIRREERYLEERFGETYRRYKAGVRRWL